MILKYYFLLQIYFYFTLSEIFSQFHGHFTGSSAAFPLFDKYASIVETVETDTVEVF